MESNGRKIEFLQVKGHEKKRKINMSQMILVFLLLSGIMLSLRDLCYSILCVFSAVAVGIIVILARQIGDALPELAGKVRMGIYLITLGCFVLGIAFVIPGFIYTVNRGMILWNERFETEWTPFAVGSLAGIGSVIFWSLVAVPLASFLWSQIRKRSIWGPMILSIITLSFGIIPGQTYMAWALIFDISGVLGIFICYSAPKRKIGIGSISFMLIIAIGIFLVGVAAEEYQENAGIEQWKENVADKMEAFRYGEDTLPKGDLTEASGLLKGEKDTLKVTMENPRELYLKGFVGGEYQGTVWNPLGYQVYQGDYAGMLGWLEEKNFSPVTQFSSYEKLSAKSENLELNHENVEIHNENAYRKFVYLPEAVKKWDAGRTEVYKDNQVNSKAFFGADNYTFQMEVDVPNAENAYPASWVDNAANDEENQYLDAESVYHAFVEDSYMKVDEKTKELIQDTFFQETDEEMDFTDVTTRIRQVLRSQMHYKANPEAFTGEKDYVRWFLEDAKEGNAVAYATAAVMAYRTAGYPARYVEGYHLTQMEAEQMEVQGDTEKMLTTENAHAWAEVYVNGMGWLPVEVVPGMYVETYTNQTVEGKAAYKVNPAKDDNGYRTDEKGQEGTQSGNQEQEDKKSGTIEKKIVAAVIMILYLCMIIYLLLELQRALRIMCLEKKWSKTQSKEEQVEKCVEEISRIFGAVHITEDASCLEDVGEELKEKIPYIDMWEYERVIELVQKSRFGGRELLDYEIHTLEAFVIHLKKVLYLGKSKKDRLVFRYWYVV